MEAVAPIDPTRVVFRRTNAHRGRRISVDARTSPLQRLAYGRIWTSWPPHEHAAMLEEMYVYYVAAPGHPIRFLWMMAAHREVEDRQFGVVRVQPGFDGNGSGLEASRR